MNKKILVIDQEKFKEQLGCFNLAEPDGNFVEEEDIFKALENSKQDTIEFGAEVETVCLDRMICIPREFADGDKLQVFVVKKDK